MGFWSLLLLLVTSSRSSVCAELEGSGEEIIIPFNNSSDATSPEATSPEATSPEATSPEAMSLETTSSTSRSPGSTVQFSVSPPVVSTDVVVESEVHEPIEMFSSTWPEESVILSEMAGTATKTVRKRAAEFYNGILTSQFYHSIDPKKPTFPPNPVMAMGRPLKSGGALPRVEFVALWNKRGGDARWGTVYGQNQNVEGTFIVDNIAHNLTSLPSTDFFRLLQYVGSEQSNNFVFKWRLARDTDPATVITQKAKGCAPPYAPAVYRDGTYEFLGEADIEARTMTYFYQGHTNTVQRSSFLNNVFLLVKERCKCSCD